MSKTVNITVNVTNFKPAYESLGLGPIPAGTTTDAAVNQIQSKLNDLLKDGWPKTYETYDESQADSAIMSPWKNNVPGTAPTCVTDAIRLDFQSWDLPVDENTITLMAKEITQQISNHGGNKGTFYGKHRIASETIQWGISFISAIVVDNPEELGIIYAFSAVLSI